MADKKIKVFEEILESEKLFGFQQWSPSISVNALPLDNPSIIWQHLQFNPWVAMAIYSDMEEKNDSISSNLETRKNGVLAKPRRIIPASDSRQDKRIAEFVEETLFDETYFNFDKFLDEALNGIGNGVEIGEMIYADGRDRVYISDVKFKPQHLFSFGATALAAYSTNSIAYPQTGPLRLRQGVLVENIGLGGELPEEQFFVFSYRPRYGNRWGSPLKRKCYWLDWMMRTDFKIWMKYQEKGSGSIVVKYPGGATQAEQQKAVDLAVAINEETAVASPERLEFQVLDTVRQLGSSHKEFVEICKGGLARIILGQTLTSQGSDGGYGSRGLGDVHNAVRGEWLEVDSKQIMATVNEKNSLVHNVVRQNFGENASRPRFIIEYESQEDLNALADRAKKLHEIRLPLSKKYLYETNQMPEPINDDDALVAQEKSKPSEEPQPDALDDELVELAEKKTLNYDGKPNSKRERFKRLRPSMIRFSDE